jgi:hypothetical protein
VQDGEALLLGVLEKHVVKGGLVHGEQLARLAGHHAGGPCAAR